MVSLIFVTGCTDGPPRPATGWVAIGVGRDTMSVQIDTSSIHRLGYRRFAYRESFAFSDTASIDALDAIDCATLRSSFLAVEPTNRDSVLALTHDPESWSLLDLGNEIVRRRHRLLCDGYEPERWIRIFVNDSASAQELRQVELDIETAAGPLADSISAEGGRRSPAEVIRTFWLRVRQGEEEGFQLQRIELACDRSVYRTIRAVEYNEDQQVVSDRDQMDASWQSILPGSVGEDLFSTACDLLAYL